MRALRLMGLALFVASCQGPVAPPNPDAGTAPPPPPTQAELPTVEPACEAELTVFEQQVHRPILVRQCAPCHNPEGPAAQSRLHLLNTHTPEAMQANWRAAGALGALQLDGTPELLLRASGTHPKGHPGGDLAPVGSAAYEALSAFVQEAVDPACNARPADPCDGPAFGPRVLRRLTRAEYEASLEDLFSRTSTRGGSLAVDPTVGGFDNHASSLVVGSLFADQLRLNAEALAQEAVEDLEHLLPCTPSPGNEEDCRDLFILRFLSRAYRRPLEPEEQARYAMLFDASARGIFSNGVKAVVTAALQSPHFLYRPELGVPDADGNYRLTNYEIASALSYFLTGRPPDDDLRSAAERGLLVQADERVRQARRLLSSLVGQRSTARFFSAWLDLDRVLTVPKDVATYPEFTPQIREAMRQETERLVRWVMLRGTGTLPELFTAPYSFVDERLEGFYGELGFGDADTEGFRRTEDSPRWHGLLTQGSLLSVHSKPSDASPIHRGKMVRVRLLCQALEPPPAGLVVDPPPVDPNLTTRERYAAHSQVEPCRSCHRLIDPIGFGFGHYDGVGRLSTTEAGQQIETYGQIVDTEHTDGSFQDLAGLAQMLADSPDVHRCFVQRWQRWAYGLDEEEGLHTALELAQTEFVRSGLRIDALLLALAGSEHLQTRTATLTRCK